MRLLILLFFISSCSTSENRQKQNIDGAKVFQSGGNEQYLLPELPYWANFSSSGSCQRDTVIQYLDFEKMNASFSLTYEQLVQFQILYHRKYREKLQEISSDFLSPSMENRLFDNVYAQISGGLKALKPPRFDRLHLIWIDKALNSPEAKERLSKLSHSPAMTKGVPIFISTCLSSSSIESFLREFKIEVPGALHIGAEAFSVFAEDYVRTSSFRLNFSQLLGSKKRLYLFSPTILVPDDLAGELIIQTY